MIFIYFLLGLIQGLTEFLPVSSSGHIILFGAIFGVQTDIILLNIVVHLGSLLSVIICMRKQLWQIIKKPFSPLTLKLAIATIPTLIIAFLFKDFFEAAFNGRFLIYGFLATALLLVIADLLKNNNKPVNNMTALIMGVMQGIAVFPGLSRSGSTISAGMLAGTEKTQVADFTFLMSIPIILASAVYKSIDLFKTSAQIEVLPLLVAFVAAALSGIVAIKLMFKIIKKSKLSYFSIYLVLISIVSYFVL